MESSDSRDGGPATSATLSEVQGARFDTAGNLYVPQCGPAAVRKIDTSGTITTVAGNGTDGFSGDGGPATAAQLNCPSGVVVDNTGKLFIADYNNDRIREVNASGVITTIAGNGTPGFSGDGGRGSGRRGELPERRGFGFGRKSLYRGLRKQSPSQDRHDRHHHYRGRWSK